MIKLENVSKYYNTEGNVSLGLRNINVELNINEIVAITGESGSGKTTFLNVISGIDTYEAGEMYFNGEPTSYFLPADMEKYRKNNVGFIFQNYNLIESYTVLQNVMTMLSLKGYSEKEAKKRALELIDKVGLTKRRHNKATKLSGGEKQRCVIARALASDSLILACDEPTGNLDSNTGKEIMELIKSVSAGRLVLIVTHNYDEVKDIATRKLRFYDGEIVEDKVIKEVDKEVTEIVPNDYQMKRKDNLKFAWRNILSTPKKTIFTFFVLLVFCFFVGSLYEVVSSSDFLANSSSGYYNSDQYALKNRVIFTGDIDKEEIETKYKDKCVVFNDYFSDLRYTFKIDDGSSSGVYIDYTGRKDYKLLHGVYPEKDDEIVIENSFGYLLSDYESDEDLLGKKVIFDFKTYTVVGITDYSYDNYRSYFHITPDNIDLLLERSVHDYWASEDCLKPYIGDSKIKSFYIDSGDLEFLYGDIVDKINGGDYFIVSSILSEEEFKKLDFKLYINDYLVDLSNYEIIYHQASNTMGYYDGFRVDMGNEVCHKIYKECLSFGSIFANSVEETNKIANELTELGYVAYNAGNVNKVSGLNYYFDFFSFVMQVITAIFGFVAIYFITYLVLSFVVLSRKKDYTILRTLGISKSNLNRIVNYENIFILLFSFLSFVVIDVMVYLIWDVKIIAFIVDGQILQILFLIVILFALSLLLSRRFNKKLFKMSVNSSLKKEAL